MDAKDIESVYPLAPQQQGIFLEHRSASVSGLHIEQEVHELHAEIDVVALECAWRAVVEHHAMLRTAFVWKGQAEPLQVVLRRVHPSINAQDWRELSTDAQIDRLEAYLVSDRANGFELNRPPLMRIALFRTGDSSYKLVRSYHHILVDGWCIPILNGEITTAYVAICRGEAPHFEPTAPYRDYVAWLKRQDTSQSEAYWRNGFSAVAAPTPLGSPAPPIERNSSALNYGYYEERVSAKSTESLQAFARRNRLTLNTLVQAAWAMVLSRYSNREEVVFGTTVSGRPADLMGIESTVGLFVNTLPFRVQAPRDRSVIPWLTEVQTGHTELRKYEHCSTGQIHQWLKLPALQPMFESILVFENYPDARRTETLGLSLEDLRTARSIGAQTNYAVTILAMVQESLLLRLVYNKRRFESGAEHIVEHLCAVLDALACEHFDTVYSLLSIIPADQVPYFRPLNLIRSDRAIDAKPRSATEAAIACIWEGLLGLECVGVSESLLDLGGHSLVASQVVARVRQEFGIDLPLSTLFEDPTVAGLAKQVEERRGNSTSPVPAIKPEPRDRTLPLSFAQQRLWMLGQMETDASIYNTSSRIRLSGPINIDELSASFTEIVARHEALRTVFAVEGESPIQVVMPAITVRPEVIDLSALAGDEQSAATAYWSQKEAERPFDLSCDLLLRAKLLRFSASEHMLLLTMHHIASDRWSITVLLRELNELYAAFKAGKPSPLPPLAIQYSDYAIWQREQVPETLWNEQLAYWRQQLADAPVSTEIATDSPRSELATFKGACYRTTLQLPVMESLQRLSRDMGCTLYMTLLAGFHTLLRHLIGRDDVLTGANIANRTHVEVEELIGFFVNQIVLRSDLSGNPTFREMLVRIRRVVLDGFANQQVPFDKVVADQKRKRAANRTPLFQILFVYNTSLPKFAASGLTVESIEFDTGASKFDLAVFFEETPQGLVADWIYKSDLFFESTITRLCRHLETVLTAISENPDTRLDDLCSDLNRSDDEQRRLDKRALAESNKRMFHSVLPKPVPVG